MLTANTFTSHKHFAAGESLDGTDFVQERIIPAEASTEWQTYLLLLFKQNGDLGLQLKELTTNETMIALLPNLHKLAAIWFNFAC